MSSRRDKFVNIYTIFAILSFIGLAVPAFWTLSIPLLCTLGGLIISDYVIWNIVQHLDWKEFSRELVGVK